MAPLISVEKLEKYFKVYKHHRGLWGSLLNLASSDFTLVRAVDGITFHLQPGELVGYLGPNGAGKSTTLKILAGLLVPTRGRVVVDNRVPWKERRQHVAQIGAVFGQRTTLWWDLPLIESLDLLQYIYHILPSRFAENLREFRDVLELDPFLNTPVRSLSLGQRMRADLCAAFLHDPKLVFLDEPTIGLDVVAKERIRQFIQRIHRERGTTIILTTHDMADIEKLCERVMIIDHGKLLYDGKLEALNTRFGGKRALTVHFAEYYPDIRIPGLPSPVRNGNQATYSFDRAQVSASELIGQVSARFHIEDLEVREPEIEDTVRRIYEEKLLEFPQNSNAEHQGE
jgi:ABC-2 type transport system ATP-binding protein